MPQGYEGLVAWQKAMDVAEVVYHLTESFPKHELYSLTQQLRRAAVFVPSNIAEGHARYLQRDFRHFLRQARGSLAEIETQLRLAGRLRYLESSAIAPVLNQTDELGRVITGLINAIQVPD